MALPPRGNFVIRNACVVTMDPALQDITPGDLHIEAGVVSGVGAPGLPAPGAAVIDGSDMIVLPGLIDAHTHLWSTQMRGRFGDTPETTYFKMRNFLSDGYLAEDVYHGTRLACAESLFSGVTTVVDFFHNNRGADFVDNALHALKDTGIRARFLYGASTRTLPSQPIDLAALEQLAASWNKEESRLTLGLAWRGPLGITTPDLDRLVTPDVGIAKEEFDAARRLQLPIAIHVSGGAAKSQFDALVEGGFLGPHLQLVHFSNASASDIRVAAQSGACLCLTPVTEMRVGYGITPLGDYLAGGMCVGLGVDGGALAGSSSMFSVMKLFQSIETGRMQDELAITARKLLQLATIDAARTIGMDQQIGSITVGKRADVIMITTRALNMGMPGGDPAHLIVEAAQPSNVDTVIVDGRILKHRGEMTALDPLEAVRQAKASIANITRRSQTVATVRPTR